jgi:orsellinic acid C2-O-methyltransferase
MDRVPSRSLSELMEGFWITRLLGTTVALGIADRLGEGAKTHEQIARSCEAEPSSVLRVLRALQTIGVCSCGPGSTFALTARGEVLRRGVRGSISGRAAFTSGIMWDLYGQLTAVVKTGRPLPAGREGFNKLAEHPGLAGMHQAMVESSIKVMETAARVHDFGRYHRVLDVGGGYGGAVSTLLRLHPGMRGAVIDLPYLAEDTRVYLRKAGVADRCQFLPGDFFEELPSGYDCYLLKYIVHDWGDTEALQILRTCAAAAGSDSHVILLERILPDALEESPDHQAIMQIDLAMMTTGGKERTAQEYRSLLASAGLQMISATGADSSCSIIQARVAVA